MKVDKQVKKKAMKNGGLQSTQINSGKKYGMLAALALLTVGGIVFVVNIGKKAEETVTVVMVGNNGVYKNQAITMGDIVPYEMLKGEYEKYSVTEQNGVKTRRLILWDERGDLSSNNVQYYAAYPLLPNTLLEKNMLVGTKVDNSDTVLYSFPGKDIVQLDVGTQDLNAFKTFLKPGDKLNIEAIYSEQENVETVDSYGNPTTDKIDVFRTETVFGNIMIADLLNSSGDSVLDIYSNYNSKNVYEQASLDASDDFKTQTTPASLLVALTPAEKEMYYKYLSKDNISFRVSLPQRTQ